MHPRDLDSRSDTFYPVIVIGGGPAGLSVGRELCQRGIKYLLLEQAGNVGESWRRMPKNMTLNSPWKVSCLQGTRWRWRHANELRSRQEYVEYLEQYQKEHRIAVRTNIVVSDVERRDDGCFSLRTNTGEFNCSSLVNATGYFCKPFIPTYPGLGGFQTQHVHMADYVEPEELKRRIGKTSGRVLIVGKRISAGQIGLELFDAGFDVSVSHRSPIEFGRPPWLKKLAFRPYYIAEHFLLKLDAFGGKNSWLPMDGGRMKRLIFSGRIETVPDIDSFTADEVAFTDGSRREYDIVLWCTGFRPALDHLRRLVRCDANTGLPTLNNMESGDVQRLFFIGLDQQRDYTSRMLRGIRRDAASVVDRVIAQENRA